MRLLNSTRLFEQSLELKALNAEVIVFPLHAPLSLNRAGAQVDVVQLGHIRPVSPFPSYHHIPDASIEVISR